MDAICVENLCFSYGKGINALQNVSFSVKSGEFVSLLGANGAGKSTLFSCILALVRRYSGTVQVEGENIRSLSPGELARRVAYVPQMSEQTFSYPAEQVVLMGTTALQRGLSSPGREEEQRAQEAMERLNIAHLRGKLFHSLSGGERQLLLIARALAQSAHILLLDEPTASLDYGNQCRVLGVMKELSRQGYTVVESTHSPDHAFMYADSVIALKNGSVCAAGPTDEVLTPELLTELYGIEVQVESFAGTRLCIPKITL